MKNLIITLALLSLFSCKNGDKSVVSKEDALSDLKDLYSEMSKIEKDSIDHPIPKPTNVEEFFETSHHATKMNDSCIRKAVLIDQKFHNYTDSGRINGGNLVDLVMETIRLKNFLALYIHRSKLNRNFEMEYASIKQGSYLSPDNAIGLYNKSDLMLQNGIKVLEGSTSCDVFIESWNDFKISWNTINQHDKEIGFK